MIPAALAKIGPQLMGAARRNAPALIVRLGRFSYLTSAGVLSLIAYTAWKNQGNELGFFETLRSGSWTPEDADKPLELAGAASGAIAGAAEGAKTGVGANGVSEREQYNERDYNARLQAITQVGASFGLHVTSGKRSDAENSNANGVGGSLHLVSSGALAFDLSSGPGPVSPNERRMYEWANTRPDIFQEVLLHNSGSGWHVHVAFRPGVTSIASYTGGASGGITVG